jgi:hypothetical protein
MSEMISCSKEFVEEALQSRYDEVRDRWGKLEDEDLDTLWEYLLEAIVDNGGPGDKTVMEIVDNFLVNGDYNYIDEYKDENETDEDFLERKQDEILYDFEGTSGHVVVFNL